MMKANPNKMRRSALAVLTTAALLSAVACASGNAPDRETVEKPGSKVTVVENKQESVYDTGLEIDKVSTLEGVRGQEWLDEERIVVMAPNAEQPPTATEGEQRQPFNLYIRAVAEGSELETLQASPSDTGFAALSPDKKHLFFKKTEEATGFGRILNLETGTVTELDNIHIPATEGAWADDSTVIFPTLEGELMQVDLQGKATVVVKEKDKFIRGLAVSGATWYYIAGENQTLFAYDKETKEKKAVAEGIDWVVPSPDGSRLALVKRSGQAGVKLVLSDAGGAEQKELASGTQIFGTSWSPDGQTLAYSLSAEGVEDQGLFMSEAETGKQTSLVSTRDLAGDAVRWSPSGKQLMMTTSSYGGQGIEFKTTIVRFKDQ